MTAENVEVVAQKKKKIAHYKKEYALKSRKYHKHSVFMANSRYLFWVLII